MSTAEIVIVIVAAVVIVLIAAWLTVRRRNTRRLRDRFGPEYDRMVETTGNRRLAETELQARSRRVSRFEIRPLGPAERDRFIVAWRAIQAEFVDAPRTALVKADDLLTEVMKARGYPVDNFEQRSADLSVDHPSVVQNYRAGRTIAVRHQHGQADTEDLRQAMIHYRALFDELVGETAQDAGRRAS